MKEKKEKTGQEKNENIVRVQDRLTLFPRLIGAFS